mmetsp:Transcript_108246/g.231120  ORF Transcript_108246/g.231120 Transcript_108246/m.231120 type:complete len:248 (-) Transcript_108246:320-1063(-)
MVYANVAEEELLEVAEEGGSEEVTAPVPVSWRRRAGFATLGLAACAALALVVLIPAQGAAPTAVAGGDESIKALIQATAESAAGRPLTEDELEMFSQHLPEQVGDLQTSMAPMRQLTGAMTAQCKKDFTGHIMKTLAQAGGMALKVMLSCPKGKESLPACTKVKTEAAALQDKLKADCIKQKSTDICTMTGAKIKTQDVCVPKSCQDAPNLKAVAKAGSTISCNGGGAGIFAPLANMFHAVKMPQLR